MLDRKANVTHGIHPSTLTMLATLVVQMAVLLTRILFMFFRLPNTTHFLEKGKPESDFKLKGPNVIFWLKFPCSHLRAFSSWPNRTDLCVFLRLFIHRLMIKFRLSLAPDRNLIDFGKENGQRNQKSVHFDSSGWMWLSFLTSDYSQRCQRSGLILAHKHDKMFNSFVDYFICPQHLLNSTSTKIWLSDTRKW